MDGSYGDLTVPVRRRKSRRQRQQELRRLRRQDERRWQGNPRQSEPIRRPPSRQKREQVYTRDRGLCRYCGERLPRHQRTLDHIVPRSRGGTNQLHNLVLACRPCNERKDDKTPTEAGMELLPIPGS